MLVLYLNKIRKRCRDVFCMTAQSQYALLNPWKEIFLKLIKMKLATVFIMVIAIFAILFGSEAYPKINVKAIKKGGKVIVSYFYKRNCIDFQICDLFVYSTYP